VQESLANAARHAAGAGVRVVVDDRGQDSVSVTVDNDATRAPRAVDTADGSGGFGLVGMRERAELTGAHLSYGPTPDGGWQVALSMPRLTDTVGDPS
jgi:signal transduction histidine kinase